MDRLLRKFLQGYVRHGNLTLITASGEAIQCGDRTGEPVVARLMTSAAQRHLILDPEMALGEIYMDGGLTLERGTITDLLEVVLGQPYAVPKWARLQWWARYLSRHWHQFNSPRRSKLNVAHHYDLNGGLYDLFLDSDKQYSCAYFEHPDASLEDAQLAKKRHIAAKLLVQPDHRILDIGCGWGGLGLYLADVAGARVTGVTLSSEQLQIANARAQSKHLADRAQFLAKDYREVPGPFDRIVSVGMFEHVGVDFYDTYFRHCAKVLADDGVMVLHSIGRPEGPGITNPWIAKYIFPGGYIPALSEVFPAIERAGLLVADVEILRFHYADTLKAWRERFLARKEEAARLYDDRFVRMWEFYLASSEMSFRKQNMMNFQIQITRRQDVVPVTRDYIPREESRLRGAEGRKGPKLQLAGG